MAGSRSHPTARGQALRCARIADPDGQTLHLTVNDAESPLAWLKRRRGRDGAALISDEAFAAGERLRADFTRGALAGGMISNWRDQTPVSGGQQGAADLTDSALLARRRVGAALNAVGTGLSGVLLDVCCFLKGLEQVELERQLPPRSAKVILIIALERLAEHYAPQLRARGPRSRGIGHWGSDDYRPVVTRPEGDQPD